MTTRTLQQESQAGDQSLYTEPWREGVRCYLLWRRIAVRAAEMASGLVRRNGWYGLSWNSSLRPDRSKCYVPLGACPAQS